MGAAFFSYYKTAIAGSITALGQVYIRRSAKAAVGYLSEMVNITDKNVINNMHCAGDTDSVTRRYRNILKWDKKKI